MNNKIIFTFLLALTFFCTINAQLSLEDAAVDPKSMLTLQPISVTVGGAFIINGTFAASATDRIDEFVTRIYNKHSLALLSTAYDAVSLAEIKEEMNQYPERGILLLRSDGSEHLIDLKKFRLLADFSENPYLLNDDVILFPQLDWDRNFIEVEGAVNKPTQFQYVEGDRLSDAILFARGINPAYANVDSVKITRLSYDGMNENELLVSISDNPILERGDRIRFLADETQKRDFKVLITGEVNKPGYIYITKNNTSIKDVILKAGGFKKNADLTNSELIRSYGLGDKSNLEYQNRRRSFILQGVYRQIDLLMMNRMADIETDDSLSLIYDNQLKNAKSIVTVDFNEVLNDSSDNSKVIIKDGDILYVPEITNLIYVFGQVMNPGYIDYIENQDHQYYIQRAGGIGNRAKDEIYLIKGKTRAWIELTDDDSVFKIESGDYIWVPKDIPRNFDYYLNRTAQIAGIIGSVATVVLLLTQIGK